MNTVMQINPATGETLGEVRELTQEELRTMTEQARNAFPAWRDTPLSERLHWMQKLRMHIVDNAEELSRRVASYTGKVYVEALMSELFTVADALHYYEKNAASFLGTESAKTPAVFLGNHSYIEYKPMGVILVISPWNFPFQLSMIPVISALIAGNSVVLKPSEVTPMVGTLIEEMFTAIDFPRHVFQLAHGGRDVGRWLVESHPDKIFFTGSVATGRKIMASASEHLIPVDLELGGKDPMIIFADADLERAANGAVWGAFTNAGQVCMSVERVFVEESVYDEFVRKVVAKTNQLRMGVDYGSMTFPPQVEIVEAHLQDALAKGAKIECGGERLQDGTLYYAPTVLTGLDPGMKILTEETFGPVMPILPFRTEEEAVRLANDSVYGLNASVWTKDLEKAKRVTSRLLSGHVCVNEVISSIANPHLPFGGVKQSGIGRYHGAIGLRTFSHMTSVMVNKGTRSSEINWYPYTKEKESAFQSLVRLLYGGTNRRVGLSAILNLFRQVLGSGPKDQPPVEANNS